MSPAIVQLATDDRLARLAHASDLRLGREILAAGGVVVTSAAPDRVTALVTPPGGQRRTVELTADENGLHCRCT